MKTLYANGCSWTEGAEIVNDSELSYCTSSMYYGSWPFQLSQVLGIPLCVNEGAGAGSNDRIYRKTQEYIIKYINSGQDPKDLMIVIGWTTPERTEIPSDGAYVRITTTAISGAINYMDTQLVKELTEYRDMYYKLYDDEPKKKQVVQMMIGLRMMCKAYGIHYYDFIAIGSQPIEYMNISKQYYNVVLDNMFWMSWNEHCETNYMSMFPGRHPTVKTHKQWAEELAEMIKE